MATEAKPRVVAQKVKEKRIAYMNDNNIDFTSFLELEVEDKVNYEVVLDLYNKQDKTSKEMVLKGDYVSLLIGSEILFKGRMEDRIETPNYILKIKEVKLIDKKEEE